MSPSPEPTATADWEAFYRDYRKPGYVAGFEITSKLGGGMFGLVYRAKKLSIGKDYAIKFLQVDDQDVRRAVLTELEQVKWFAQIDHPNLVSIEDRGEVDGIPFLVMAFAGTETLRDKLVAGRVPGGDDKDQLLRWFLQACRGLAALHERSLVHFDVKPANVFLKGAVARLGDYGLSKLVTHSRGSLSMGRGTPYYMAPELLQRRGDHRSDLYSLGVMLYELLCGKVPFTGDSEWEVLKQHETKAPELPPFLQPNERAALTKCLAKDPAQRFQHVAELMAVLGAPTTVGAAAWNEASAATTAAAAPPPPPAPSPPPAGAPVEDPYAGLGKASREAMRHASVIARQAAQRASVAVKKAIQDGRARGWPKLAALRGWVVRQHQQLQQRRELRRQRREQRAQERLARRQARRRRLLDKLAGLVFLVVVVGLGLTWIRANPERVRAWADSARAAATTAASAPAPAALPATTAINSSFQVPLAVVGRVATATPAWVELATHDVDRAHAALLAHIEELRRCAPLSPEARGRDGELPTFGVAAAAEPWLQRAQPELAALLRLRSTSTAARRLADGGAVALHQAAWRLETLAWTSRADVDTARRLHQVLQAATRCDDIVWVEPEADTPQEQARHNRGLGKLWLWFCNEFAFTEQAWRTYRRLLNFD
ncbi:MAG: serine/threonine protein kinase [Planctomycetes bacterium]|nr:serine/threonine protein kinase [Planctomycetota bacterium]